MLVDSAACEIREVGWFATSTNRIAHRAGLSAGAFYNYFGDKVDVLLAVYGQWQAEEWCIITTTGEQDGCPDEARLARLVPRLVEHHVAWVRLRHALVVLSRDDHRVRVARMASRARQISGVIQLLGRTETPQLRAAVALRILSFEVVADTIACGEDIEMQLDRTLLTAELERYLVTLGEPAT